MPRFDPLPKRPFRFDYLLIVLLLLGGAVLYGLDWLARHPEHDPRAPLTIAQPEGWATGTKLAALRESGAECRAVLTRSGIAFDDLAPVGEGQCRRADRLVPGAGTIDGLTYAPRMADASCSVHAAIAWWLVHRVQPAARDLLDSEVAEIMQLGTANCRRINGASTGRWSEHATGNAIDIAGFRLIDGREISVLRDWASDDPERDDAEARFLRAVRDGACDVFGTTLSPDYNVLHADHFHLDQAQRGLGGYCR